MIPRLSGKPSPVTGIDRPRIDARDGWVATHGWLRTTEVTAEELAKEMVRHGAETFIFTDISRDGTLSGPNVGPSVPWPGPAGNR